VTRWGDALGDGMRWERCNISAPWHSQRASQRMTQRATQRVTQRVPLSSASPGAIRIEEQLLAPP
jgi:hypothetical protein